MSHAGSSGNKGRIIYFVAASVQPHYIEEFIEKLSMKVSHILTPFFQSTTIEQLLDQLPNNVSCTTQDIIASRWPFLPR
jgi:hypothetical protein